MPHPSPYTHHRNTPLMTPIRLPPSDGYRARLHHTSPPISFFNTRWGRLEDVGLNDKRYSKHTEHSRSSLLLQRHKLDCWDPQCPIAACKAADLKSSAMIDRDYAVELRKPSMPVSNAIVGARGGSTSSSMRATEGGAGERTSPPKLRRVKAFKDGRAFAPARRTSNGFRYAPLPLPQFYYFKLIPSSTDYASAKTIFPRLAPTSPATAARRSPNTAITSSTHTPVLTSSHSSRTSSTSTNTSATTSSRSFPSPPPKSSRRTTTSQDRAFTYPTAPSITRSTATLNAGLYSIDTPTPTKIHDITAHKKRREGIVLVGGHEGAYNQWFNNGTEGTNRSGMLHGQRAETNPSFAHEQELRRRRRGKGVPVSEWSPAADGRSERVR